MAIMVANGRKDISGADRISEFFSSVVATHVCFFFFPDYILKTLITKQFTEIIS